MTLGPLEFDVIQFPGDRFTGEILPELEALRAKKIIRLVDLVFVRRDADGAVSAMETTDLTGSDAEKYGSIVKESLGLLASEDIEQAAQDLPPNSAAAIVLFEHTWRMGLRDAIARAGGSLVTQGLVGPDVMEEVAADLAATR